MSSTDQARNQLATAAANQGQGGAQPRSVFDLVQVMEPQIAKALPGTLDATRLSRIMVTELRKNPSLAECNPESFLGAMMTAAQLGLEPGPMQQCYLIPRKREVQFMLGYRGIIELAMRSGQVMDINAHVVYDGDLFAFKYGTDPELTHTPALNHRGAPIGAYAVARLHGGGAPFVVLNLEDIEARRKRSSSNTTRDTSPWVSDWDAMARKSAVRALAPYLPSSAEFMAAMNHDETVRQVRNEVAPLDQVEPRSLESSTGDVPPAPLPAGESTGEPGGTAGVGVEPPPAVPPAAPPAAPPRQSPAKAQPDVVDVPPAEPAPAADECSICALPAPYHEDGCPNDPAPVAPAPEPEVGPVPDPVPTAPAEQTSLGESPGDDEPPVDANAAKRGRVIGEWCTDAGMDTQAKRTNFLLAYSEGEYGKGSDVPVEEMHMVRAAAIRVKRGELEVQTKRGTVPVLYNPTTGLVATRAGDPVDEELS